MNYINETTQQKCLNEYIMTACIKTYRQRMKSKKCHVKYEKKENSMNTE